MIAAGPALRQIVEHGEHAVVRLVGRDRRGPAPRCRSRRCRNCRPAATLASIPALSKPNVPISGLGAAGASAAGGAVSSTGGGGISAAGVAQPASAVPAARTAINFFMSSIPSGNLFDLRALPRSVAPLAPFVADPPAPSDERHPISCERDDRGDHGKPGDHRRSRIGEAARLSQRHTLAWVVASTCKVVRSASEAHAGCRRSLPQPGRRAWWPGWTGRSWRRRSRHCREAPCKPGQRRRSGAPAPSGKCRRTGRWRPRAGRSGG